MSQEILNLVDENDNLIGEIERDKAHSQGLWHRSATVFVFNKKNKLLIQKRALNMDWPNLWCGSASGHVLFNETYEKAAQRELKEEIGIQCDFKPYGKIVEENISPSGLINKEHKKLFVCHSDGPFKIQREELSKIKFISIKKLKKLMLKKPERFTPGFKQEFKYYLDKI